MIKDVDKRVINHEMVTHAQAIHFFCFLTKATIPNMSASTERGIPKNIPMIVIHNINHTILSIRLVIESHDFTWGVSGFISYFII
jgi:hypothetical protein